MVGLKESNAEKERIGEERKCKKGNERQAGRKRGSRVLWFKARVSLCLPGICFCGRVCGISGGDAINWNDFRDVK